MATQKVTTIRPNIVFILCDNVGWGDFSCYGGSISTPRIDKLGAFLKTLAIEPPIKPGTPDPYLPPKSGEMRLEEHLQIGVITQYINSLTRTHKDGPPPSTGFDRSSG